MRQPRNRNPLVPFGMITGRVLRALSRRAAPVASRSMCMIRAPDGAAQCDDGQCDWLASLLRMALPPTLAEGMRPNPFTGIFDNVEEAESEKKIRSREPQLVHPAVDRIIAIGDVHGDVDAFRKSLEVSGVLGNDDTWIGGKTVLVQVGDQLDRGDSERSIYDLLFRLQDSAPKSGGAVHILLGNHELMNVKLDFRYVTKGGFGDFNKSGPTYSGHKTRISRDVMSNINALPSTMRSRAKALSPGGPLAAELAQRSQISVIVGDNVFVHGGLSPQHLTFGGKAAAAALKTLAKVNDECRLFLLGKGTQPQVLRGGKSPIWMRDYSQQHVRPASAECRMLAETLKMIKARRMIVGHTPQWQGINAACSGRVWRVDTGMSAAYGGIPEALEISRRGRIRIFSPIHGIIQGSSRYK